MNQNQKYEYLSTYKIRTQNPLWLELATVIEGIGKKNSLFFLNNVLKEKTDLRKITFKDLTEKEIKDLETFIEKGILKVDRSEYANCKNRKKNNPDQYEIIAEEKNSLIVGNLIKSNMTLDKNHLIKINCNIGIRHTKGLKVHGQKTKCTGRKNKISRGYLAKKKKK